MDCRNNGRCVDLLSDQIQAINVQPHDELANLFSFRILSTSPCRNHEHSEVPAIPNIRPKSQCAAKANNVPFAPMFEEQNCDLPNKLSLDPRFPPVRRNGFPSLQRFFHVRTELSRVFLWPDKD